MTQKEKSAFTLTEVLITLGIIGVVAAVTMPTLLTNIQDRVRKEQVRTVKYKLTKATDTMNSLGKIGAYGTLAEKNSSELFVNELKKHMSIAKICKSTELGKCWPSVRINAYQNDSTTLSEVDASSLQTGSTLKALALSTKDTRTVGIVTGDGVPMIMVYSPNCSGFDEAKTYTWSVENGKPVTNATTNCISAIFDINGAKGPNKIGQDVRTLNSLFGSTDLGVPEPVGEDICKKMKQKYGFKYCNGEFTISNNDRWVGGIYECDKLGLHLPSPQTLAVIAVSKYGDQTISVNTNIFSSYYGNCLEWISKNWGTNHYSLRDQTVENRCNVVINIDENSSVGDVFNGQYWSNFETANYTAFKRAFFDEISHVDKNNRSSEAMQAFCLGD